MQKSRVVHLSKPTGVLYCFLAVEALTIRTDGRDLKLSEWNDSDKVAESRNDVSILAD